jgi:hypothetical protein
VDDQGGLWRYAEIYHPQLQKQATCPPVTKQENEIGRAVTTDGWVLANIEARKPVVKMEPSAP